MRKPVIGIIGSKIDNAKRPFHSYTKFVDNYSKRVKEAGGIPIGLLNDEFDAVNLCDGFIICGGSEIQSLGVNIINYSIKNRKPVLGICLGMQTMAAFEWGFNAYKVLTNEVLDLLCESEEKILTGISNHNKVSPFYLSKIEYSKHNIILNSDSRLAKIYNSTIIDYIF